MRIIALLALLSSLAACATASRLTIADRLQALGLDRDRSVCMSQQLDQRLSSSQLADFADFTVTLTRGESPIGVLNSLTSISDPQIARAAAQSGISCLIAR